jgi:hypothetical protein
MADILFNGGKPKDVAIPKKFENEVIFLSAAIEMEDDKTKIAGHSIVNLAGKASIEDVQFDNHELATGAKIDGKLLSLMVDVSKFKIKKKQVAGDAAVATCKLKFTAGDKTIKEFSIDDSENAEFNSVFIFAFTFSIK